MHEKSIRESHHSCSSQASLINLDEQAIAHPDRGINDSIMSQEAEISQTDNIDRTELQVPGSEQEKVIVHEELDLFDDAPEESRKQVQEPEIAHAGDDKIKIFEQNVSKHQKKAVRTSL